METTLTFGEYLRRLRRDRRWSLHQLAEQTGLSYTHLSRLENDSTLPRADTVAKLAEALDGDLKELLTLADCLPQLILDRIVSRPETSGVLLRRVAGPGESPRAASQLVEPQVAERAARDRGLDPEEALAIGEIVDRLVSLDVRQRESLLTIIRGLQGDQ